MNDILTRHDRDLKEKEEAIIESLAKQWPSTQLKQLRELILIRYARRRDGLVLDNSPEQQGRALELRDLLTKALNFPE